MSKYGACVVLLWKLDDSGVSLLELMLSAQASQGTQQQLSEKRGHKCYGREIGSPLGSSSSSSSCQLLVL